MQPLPAPADASQLLRAFIAVEIGEKVRDALESAVKHLRATPAQVKWVARENWHLTVKFLGDVERRSTEDITRALQEEAARAQAFNLSVRGLHPFPPGRQPRIVAAAVFDAAGGLAKLNARLEERMQLFGVAPERRGFQAHLTLGRVNGPRGQEALWKALRAFEQQEFGACGVYEAVLFQSELLPQGARYTKLAAAQLGHPAS